MNKLNTIWDTVFKLSDDIRDIRLDLSYSFQYLQNSQVATPVFEWFRQQLIKERKNYRVKLSNLSANCTAYDRLLALEQRSEVKELLSKKQEENCNVCDYSQKLYLANLVLCRNLYQSNFNIEIRSILLEEYRKVVNGIGRLLLSEFEINSFLGLWIEILYVYKNQDDTDFIELLFKKMKNPLLMLQDINNFVNSHIKYIGESFNKDNNNQNEKLIFEELKPIYDKINTDYFDLYFATSLRQIPPQRVKAFLTYNENNYTKGVFRDLVEATILEYHNYINPTNIQLAKSWLSTIDVEKLEATNKDINKSYNRIKGQLSDEQIRGFFSFLYKESNKDNTTFLTKNEVDKLLENGFVIYDNPAHKKLFINFTAKKTKKILYYCFYKLFEKHSYNPNDKSLYVDFIIQNFEGFDKIKPNSIGSNMKSDEPPKMYFNIEKYLEN